MRLVQHGDDATAFLEATEDFLMADEVAHNTLLGVVRGVQDGYTYDDVFLAHVEDENGVVLAVMRTAPHGPVLSFCNDDAAVTMVADALHTRYDALPYVLSTPEIATAFATRWQALSGQSFYTKVKEGIYVCENVVPPQNVPGEVRPAARADRGFLIEWMYRFGQETGIEANYTMEQARRSIDRRLDQPVLCGLLLWVVDGEPVSMAATARESKHTGVVAPVYTPPEHRRKGYASAVTAAVTQKVLDEKQYAALYTDLANPTSNKIYQAIGYRHVCNHHMMAFDDV
jgi:hypothetical protein